ncbi:phenylalanine--tRNA ligase subunit beta [Virgibacillus sp. W0430]|uniref:phenylalanine--tRNA ligase subunit beta n=1 Tax=Virgibacillus sp. W0430 TaxID=3391580 RepID=UPI003F4778BA
MLVSLNWLKNYVDFNDLSPEKLAELITKSGIEVDGIHPIAPPSENVVIGYVESCEQHPNADRLNVCHVDVGTEKLQIICGAPNVAQGQKVVVAKPGAILPRNFKIKKVKLRGIESNGMICSLKELGVEERYIPTDMAEGIIVLSNDVSIGEDATSILNLDDTVLEFDLTPNRADALSMLGVAYDVSAILGTSIHLPDETVETADEASTNYVTVSVEDKELTPYYGAFIIKDIEIKQAPLWMRNYLIAAGIRPINNVVDITNYVLLEYGQPLHAFDYDRLNSKQIHVRRARSGENITTLDNQVRTLSNEHLVITDGETPVALAGVMGGADTEVHEDTRTILLEAAYFDSASVRKTVQHTGLRSEASTRFEKGVDPNRVKQAGIRACQLLQKYANGTVLAGTAEFDALDRNEKTIVMDRTTVNKRLGTNISNEEVEEILTKLRFSFDRDGDTFTLSIPTRRGDITIFEDMLEEVARIYGYDRLPFTLPANSSQPGGLSKPQKLKRKIKGYLQSAGLIETITYSLTNESSVQKLISPEIKQLSPVPIGLAMPMTEDHQYLRLSILPELLQTVAYNQARAQQDIAYYEIGSVFITNEEQLTKQPNEVKRLAGALTGNWVAHKWQQEHKQVDFFVVKGIIEGLMRFLNIPIQWKQDKVQDMHPGRCAVLTDANDRRIGFVGQIHPALAKSLDLKETYVFDLNLESIMNLTDDTPKYSAIPRYPSVMRDAAFIVDKDIVASDVQKKIEEVGAPLVKKVDIFDVYTGENVAEDKKSIAYSLHYQHPDKTLKDKEVEASFTEVVQQVCESFNAKLRM